MAGPLTALLYAKQEQQWQDVYNRCFEELKTALYETPVLSLPYFSKPVLVEPDASDQAVGVVMLQPEEGKLHPVRCFSKKYLLAKRNCPAHEKDLLAIFKACMKWRYYLDGHPTTMYTEHKPLVNLSR